MEVTELVDLIKLHYSKPDNAVGGVLHIVTDDENLAKRHIIWVLNEAKKVNDTLAITIAEELLKMDFQSRRKVISLFNSRLKHI